MKHALMNMKAYGEVASHGYAPYMGAHSDGKETKAVTISALMFLR